MIYVVVRSTDEKWNNKIVNRCDAWDPNGITKMDRWVLQNGWVCTGREITPMGDMIIWVE